MWWEAPHRGGPVAGQATPNVPSIESFEGQIAQLRRSDNQCALGAARRRPLHVRYNTAARSSNVPDMVYAVQLPHRCTSVRFRPVFCSYFIIASCDVHRRRPVRSAQKLLDAQCIRDRAFIYTVAACMRQSARSM